MGKVAKGRLPPENCTRLTINIDRELLKRLKINAVQRGQTVRAVIVEALRAAGVK